METFATCLETSSSLSCFLVLWYACSTLTLSVSEGKVNLKGLDLWFVADSLSWLMLPNLLVSEGLCVALISFMISMTRLSSFNLASSVDKEVFSGALNMIRLHRLLSLSSISSLWSLFLASSIFMTSSVLLNCGFSFLCSLLISLILLIISSVKFPFWMFVTLFSISPILDFSCSTSHSSFSIPPRNFDAALLQDLEQ
uniref:Env-like protein n=1 Tax=Elysia chlorotica TaxID=188477 RepID=A0A1S5V2N1_ELYCH|nr:env-like protein [Elysia chlorotica]